MTLTRISITIPHDLVDAADRRAKALQRSRSWLLVEALRQHLGLDGRQPVAPFGAVREAEASYRPVDAAPKVAAARRRRLAAELRHSPAGRVLAALGDLGYGYAREFDAREILSRPITVIGDDPQVDIFTVAWTVNYVDAEVRSSVVEIDGVAIPLIALGDLIAPKLTGRPLDAADVEALEEIRRLSGAD